MKVLLLNPPGDKKYLRDFLCSTVSKTGYYWHPIDLLVQSGFLSKKFDVRILDAIAEHMSFDRVLETIISIKPDIVFSLIGVLSLDQDMAFMKHINQALPDMKIFVSGEPVLEEPEAFMKMYDFITGGMFGFIYDDISAYVEERYNNIKGMIYRKDNEIIMKSTTAEKGPLKFPIPKHELFPLKRYWMPFILHHPFASILTVYGCPYTCSYCNSGMDTLGLKVRDIGDVIEEIKYVTKLGIKHIFIKDMTFGVPRKHTMDLCNEIIHQDIKITWNCYSRADVVDEELLRLMKDAGCTMIQFGVESANESILSRYKKGISIDAIVKAFEMVHKFNILAGAHFIFGLPGDSFKNMEATVALAKKLNPAYASFNVATPRYGTLLRSKLIHERNTPVDVVNTLVRKANKDFYLRPSYIFHLLNQIKTVDQFKSVAREGVGIIRTLEES